MLMFGHNKLKMELDREELIEWTRLHIGDLVAGFCFFIIGLMLFMLKRQYTIGLLALVSVTAIAVERRAKQFDKIISLTIIFFLAVGFMIFD